MLHESKEGLIGVAAFIVPKSAPFKVITVEELLTKRETNKISGQRSIPKESLLYPGESPLNALRRVLTEEVEIVTNGLEILPRRLDAIEFCRVKPVDRGYVGVYLLKIPYNAIILPGSATDEVCDPRLDSIYDLQYAPRFFYRGGDREAGFSYCNFLVGRCKMPDIYETVVDRIPESVFDELEANQNKVLSPNSVAVLL